MKKIVLVEAGHPTPHFWMDETGEQLRGAVTAYLRGGPMSAEQLELMRLYLLQWITSPVRGQSRAIDQLRRDANTLVTRADIDEWLSGALDLGLDPL
jgi:hypothetical protein